MTSSSSSSFFSGINSTPTEYQTSVDLVAQATERASEALASQEASEASATSSQNYSIAAGNSATSAANQAASAATSATNAVTAKTAAETAATNAASSATNAANSAASVLTSETNAGNSASAAATSATAASTSATNAATSSTAAGTSATNASNSASAASSSATNAANSATSASTSATNAATSATTATNQATTATTHATNASNSATAAGTSATNAANSATAASTSATNAASSATAAASSASEASTSATNAATSASNAASTLSGAMVKTSNLSDVSDVATARTNLGLGSVATESTVPVSKGGTGLTSLTAGYIPFGAGTSAFGNSANLFWDNTNTRLGIGTSSPSYPLHVVGDIYGTSKVTLLSSASYLPQINLYNQSADATGPYWTCYKGRAGGTTSQNGDNIGAFIFKGYDTSNVATTGAQFQAIQTSASGSGSVPMAFVFSTNGSERLRIDSSGAVGIGGIPTNNQTSLLVARNATGNVTQYLNFTTGQVQSDVTSTVRYYQSVASTVAATFTLSDLHHFNASQGTFGAGSTVTAQYGFHAQSNLIGATNNFGFYSNIASGTGRWNFYANGTADNYFAGNTLIGANAAVTSIFGAIGRLQVTGTNFSTSTTTLSRFSNDTGASGINYVKSRAASVGSYQIVQNGDLLGAFYWTADNGVNYGSQAAAIDATVDGTPSSTSMPGRIAFSTTAAGATTSTERLRITSSGNVGIGTSSPSQKLDVNGTIWNKGGANVGSIGMLQGNTSNTGSLGFYDNSNNRLGYSGYADNTGGTIRAMWGESSTNGMVFGTNNQERLRIDSSGNVGIGTSSPSTTLTVAGSLTTSGGNINVVKTSGAPTVELQSNQAAGYAPSVISLNRIGAGYTATPDNSSVGAINFLTMDTTGAWKSSAGIYANIGVNASGGAPSYLVFATAPSGSTYTERMRIDSSGNVGIGTSSPSTKLHVSSGDITITNGTINASATTSYAPQASYTNTAADATGPYFIFRKGRANGTTSQSGDTLGNLAWYGYDTANSATFAAGISVGQATSAGSNSVPANMMFYTNGNNERLRIGSNGNVSIGTADTATYPFRVYTNSNSTQLINLTNANAGASATCGFRVENDNAKYFDVLIPSGASATPKIDTAANIGFALNTSGTQRVLLDASGNVVINTAAIATNATDGFIYIPTCAGAATGTATTYTGRAPMVVDSTNNRLYIRVGSTWKYATLN